MTHTMDHIEKLRERLDSMIANKADNMELYEMSTELDTWITRYYTEQ